MKHQNIPNDIIAQAYALLPDRAKRSSLAKAHPKKQIKQLADDLVPKRARKGGTNRKKKDQKVLKEKQKEEKQLRNFP